MNYEKTQGGILAPREKFVPGTVKPEADYEEFARLGTKLGLPCPQAHVSLESLGPDGELHDWHHDRSRTLNRNYWNWLFKQFGGLIVSQASTNNSMAMASDTVYGAGHLTNKQTTGTILNTNTISFFTSPGIYAGLGIASGVVCGTGTAAESFDDFALGALIANGTTAGQMSYQAMSLSAPTYNSGTLTWTWTIPRIMNNNSGGTIVVGETGIYALAQNVASPNYMIMRDKLAATVSVLNGGQLTVTYTMTLTFPA